MTILSVPLCVRKPRKPYNHITLHEAQLNAVNYLVDSQKCRNCKLFIFLILQILMLFVKYKVYYIKQKVKFFGVPYTIRRLYGSITNIWNHHSLTSHVESLAFAHWIQNLENQLSSWKQLTETFKIHKQSKLFSYFSLVASLLLTEHFLL